MSDQVIQSIKAQLDAAAWRVYQEAETLFMEPSAPRDAYKAAVAELDRIKAFAATRGIG